MHFLCKAIKNSNSLKGLHNTHIMKQKNCTYCWEIKLSHKTFQGTWKHKLPLTFTPLMSSLGDVFLSFILHFVAMLLLILKVEGRKSTQPVRTCFCRARSKNIWCYKKEKCPWDLEAVTGHHSEIHTYILKTIFTRPFPRLCSKSSSQSNMACRSLQRRNPQPGLHDSPCLLCSYTGC